MHWCCLTLTTVKLIKSVLIQLNALSSAFIMMYYISHSYNKRKKDCVNLSEERTVYNDLYGVKEDSEQLAYNLMYFGRVERTNTSESVQYEEIGNTIRAGWSTS